MTQVDLLIINAAQVVTCAGSNGPKRGDALRDVGLIENGAVAVSDGEIVSVGGTTAMAGQFTARQTLDAEGQAVVPGFVDCHTHVVYAGDRVTEFEQRISGTSYMEIMQAGGGIASTMRAVRAASVAQLVAESRPRLDAMLALGTTTIEVKTGYGLNTEAEMNMLHAIAQLDAAHPADLIPTFLGAHAIPPEYKTNPDGYVDLVINQMLPAAARWFHHSPFTIHHSPFFCDVFCEANVFSREQSERVLRAGLAHGLTPKLHADEFESLGGVSAGGGTRRHLRRSPGCNAARGN